MELFFSCFQMAISYVACVLPYICIQMIQKFFLWVIAFVCIALSSSFVQPVSAVNATPGQEVNVPWWGETDAPGSEPKLITTIKKAINLILSFLGLIALIILLYGGFQMVTAAGNDEKYKAGFKILRQAGIGLIFVWVAGLFVNFVFWIIGSIAS